MKTKNKSQITSRRENIYQYNHYGTGSSYTLPKYINRNSNRYKMFSMFIGK